MPVIDIPTLEAANTLERLARLVDRNDLLVEGCSRQFWDANLFDMGLVDSMGVVYLLELIREEFRVDLDLSMLVAELTSLDAIARYLDSH